MMYLLKLRFDPDDKLLYLFISMYAMIGQLIRHSMWSYKI